MSISDEAWELARELARKRPVEPVTSKDPFIRTSQMAVQLGFENRLLPRCVERLIRWFDDVGMLPHPPLDSGERKWRTSQTLNWSTERWEPCEVSYVEITWRFGGYGYRASFSEASPASSPGLEVEISVGGRWVQATEKALRRARGQEG